MSCNAQQDFCIELGETFHPTIRWGTDVIASAPISAISQAAPVVITTGAAHNLPNGWPCAVVSAQGMSQINANRYPPSGSDWKKGTVLSSTQVALNSVNSADFAPYTSGGFLVYSTPAALSGVHAAFTVWDNPQQTGTPLISLTDTSGITIDLTLMTLTPLFQTAGLTWTTGYYQLDVTDPAGIVTQLVEGVITIEP